ncbi:hypothetical protein STANM337S_05876 [Streptomyces tanashiensis]
MAGRTPANFNGAVGVAVLTRSPVPAGADGLTLLGQVSAGQAEERRVGGRAEQRHDYAWRLLGDGQWTALTAITSNGPVSARSGAKSAAQQADWHDEGFYVRGTIEPSAATQ